MCKKLLKSTKKNKRPIKFLKSTNGTDKSCCNAIEIGDFVILSTDFYMKGALRGYMASCIKNILLLQCF